MTVDPVVCGVYERGDSRRVVKEVSPQSPDLPAHHYRLEVIYALYRREKRWSNQRGHYEEWLYLREGYCSLRTWRRAGLAKVGSAEGVGSGG